MAKKITFQVDTRLAKLLSENYRSTEKAAKELVDNAWDADASKVEISLPDPVSKKPIVVKDNGSGMTEEELLNEYLLIARDRRTRRGELTSGEKRRVKGRKGIGKFAGLMIADSMTLETKTRGKMCKFTISTKDLEKAANIEKLPIDLSITDLKSIRSHGTKITLSHLVQGLSFPLPDKMRQLLLQEYGREEGFEIYVNGKLLGVDDISGSYTDYSADLPSVGIVKLKFTVSNQKGKLKKPGISIRVGGKTIGEPHFFGLADAEDFPAKLLNKIYGEIEVDGLIDHVTADWGALIENSELFNKVVEHVQPIIRNKVRDEYSKEISIAQSRFKQKIKERLSRLPEYKRQYADRAIRSVLQKYYGEPEEKIEPMVTVLLDALERTEYRTILDFLHQAKHSEVAMLAETLAEFGMSELVIIGEQARTRLEFLDRFEELCKNKDTDESVVHKSLEKNLWVFGPEYSVFSSNITLKRQVEEYLGRKYTGKRASKRPDLMLSKNHADQYLLVEFKRPSHSLAHKDYTQATTYRNDFVQFTDSEIRINLIGGKRGKSLPPLKNREPNTDIVIIDELLSNARNQLNWLLVELGGERHA